MKILFINPSLRMDSPTLFLPVGLGCVTTYVRQNGYDFDLLDIDLHRYDNAYVEKFIKESNYDVILLGCIVTHYKWVKWCAKMIKKHHPDSTIIVGNSVAGSIPEVFLTHTPADIVVIGEGEISTLEALNTLRDKTPLDQVLGIAFRKPDGTFKITPPRPVGDINEFPIIDWGIFEVEKYFEKTDTDDAFGVKLTDGQKWRTMPVATARGCIARCTFCHFVFWNDAYRHRSPESIVEECRRNVEDYGANFLNFWDDLSFSSVNSAEKVVDAILESGLKFYWSAAIRTDLFGNPKISYEKRLRVAQKFKDSGCVQVGYSLESGNKEILAMMEKKVKMEYFEEQVKLLKKVGIASHTSIVLGYPIETKETIRETFDMCFKNKIYPSIGFLLPLPSTGMYKYAQEHGYITDEDNYLDSITERQDICINLTKMSDSEILEEIKTQGSLLNEKLGIGLSNEQLIRTGGEKNHLNKELVEERDQTLNPEKLKRNENDFSFNYSQQVFDINPGGEGNS